MCVLEPCAVQVSMLHVNMMLFSYSTSCTARLKASLYTLTPSSKFPWSRHSVTCCLCQIQGDKEKLLYELDSVQAELEKCRMISERWTKQYFSLHISSNIYLDSKNILLLRLFFPGCRRRRRTLWRTSTARGSSMTSCRWANFFVFFFYDLRKLFSFSSLRPEETFLYCFFKIWGNVFRPFWKRTWPSIWDTLLWTAVYWCTDWISLSHISFSLFLFVSMVHLFK